VQTDQFLTLNLLTGAARKPSQKERGTRFNRTVRLQGPKTILTKQPISIPQMLNGARHLSIDAFIDFASIALSETDFDLSPAFNERARE
jgi:hypothetical protein